MNGHVPTTKFKLQHNAWLPGEDALSAQAVFSGGRGSKSGLEESTMLGRVVILSGELIVFDEVFCITSLRWELGSRSVLFCPQWRTIG